MIEPVSIVDNELRIFLYQNTIVNYFILLGIEMSSYREIFEGAWAQRDKKGQIKAALFKRKTGNMQFYGYGDFDAKEFGSIMKNENFTKLIGEEGVLKPFNEYINFSKIEKGAFISRLMITLENLEMNIRPDIKRVSPYDIDRIVELYRTSFKSFAPPEIIRDKLIKGRGRGYYIEDRGKIVCTVQTAFEDSDSAVIVGVATHPDYRNRGYASHCLKKLCGELTSEGKKLALQYDNIEAGSIYRSLGFVETERMISCYPEVK